MKYFLISLLFFSTAFGSNPECTPENQQESFLSLSDFKWGQSLEELVSRFTNLYQSDKRLKQRAFWDSKANQFFLPYNSFNGGTVQLSPQLIESVTSHIEKALQLRVVDAVFFSDMGHSHLLIPQVRFDQIYSQFEVKEFSRMYKDLFQDSSIKILYHTAEQLKTRDDNGVILPDPRIQHRFKTRNLVGPNNKSEGLQFLTNPNSSANTAHELEGYKYWGAGFNLSAHKNGCFPFQANGQTYYFDLSLFDLESPPGEFDLN